MKKVLMLVSLCFIANALHAQLAHTKWKGAIKGDDPRNTVLAFGKDTLVVYQADGTTPIETMTYTTNAGVLTVTKIAGQSDCAPGTSGKYSFQLKAGVMTISIKADDCDDRSSALGATQWTKMK